MELDPKDVVDAAQQAVERASEKAERSEKRLNALVAVTVALLATFMAICKVKDDNLVQAMQQAQADKLDHWAYYQARTLRQEMAEATVTQLELAQGGAPDAARAAAIAKYRALAQDQAQKREQLRQQAETDQRNYDALNYRDDQFDLADAALAIAVAMLAITALTHLWPLYWAALVPVFFGALMGLSGLAGWHIHPDALTRLLS